MKKENKAFTLVEVLIVIVILGVVAALTIPSLMANKDKIAWTSQLQKIYAEISIAHQKVLSDNGGRMSSLFPPSDASYGKVALNGYAKYLKIQKNCGSTNGCLYDNLQNINGSLWNGNGKWDSQYSTSYAGKAILVNGALIQVVGYDMSCNDDDTASLGTGYIPDSYKHYCGTMTIDVNGKKGPNKIGSDVYDFDITNDGIFPDGTGYTDAEINASCLVPSPGNGWLCAARVLKEKAINY